MGIETDDLLRRADELIAYYARDPVIRRAMIEAIEQLGIDMAQQQETTQTGYDRNMKGALFANNNRASDKHPHYNGSVVIDDVKYWLAGWKRESRAGVTYLGLSVTRDTTKQEQEPARSDIPSDVPEQAPLDDIPF